MVAALRKSALIALLTLTWAGCQTSPELGSRVTTAPKFANPSAHHPTAPVAQPKAEKPPEAPVAVTNVTVVPDDLVLAPPAPLISPIPAAPVETVTSTPPAIVINQPSPPTAWPSNWVNAWIPMESWGKYNGLGKPTQLAAGANPTYRFPTTNGSFAFKIGSRLALCNGLTCWLGYAPLLVKGLPCIHWLDAQKMLQPLLGSSVFHFSGSRTIVLDPGHGGKDVGTKSSVQSAYEKDYTLDCALRLRSILANNGWKVVLTRTNDLDVSLAERVAVAERANAALFLSLHFNSGLPNRELAGIETYCLTPVGLPSSLVRDYEDNIHQVFPNNTYDEQNLQLAYTLHRSVVQLLAAPDRGVKRARFMSVLRAQNRPAVLIEGGYLSNPAEAKRIASAEYRQKLAEAVARALD